MKQKLLILLALIFLIVVLVGLNAVSYVQQEKTPDSEMNPNRSTYNSGATGTRAFYDLLAETGRRVVRWQEPPPSLLTEDKNAPDTFVIIGSLPREFEEKHVEDLLEWVSAGGQLVIIDRTPPEELIRTKTSWRVFPAYESENLPFGVDASDQQQMTDKTVAGKPVQPSVYTASVNAVQPSRFASSIDLQRLDDKAGSIQGEGNGRGAPPKVTSEEDYHLQNSKPPRRNANSNEPYKMPATPSPTPLPTVEINRAETSVPTVLTAPVVHVANDKKNLLVDFPYGSGKIVFLTDPYIVSNGGINLVDNAQLAVNIVASRGGLIAFDEYHHGYGTNNNQLLNYFAGTPVTAIFLQLAALIGLILLSQSRRFARPLPDVEPNRLSKLEYVSAMAELQQRTRAFDLAVENIYTDFRRRVSRYLGVDNYTITRREMASLIAERAELNSNDVEDLMFKCEEIIQGEPTNKKEVLRLVSRMREIEEKFGLKRQRASRKGM